ncbi:uncharacterized protein TNCV_566611 [Trichonephila clavipes]|nr:uncharacterized protein TNCV_566611 [Trichonephila clavipes]
MVGFLVSAHLLRLQLIKEQILSLLMRELTNMMGSHRIHSASYHPQRLRSAMKNDLKATSSELVYGTTLRLPSDLISSESLQTSVTPTYVSKPVPSVNMEDISAVKIPAFVLSDPALWFGMLESTFELAVPKPITDERTKYNYCVAHLSPDAAMAVRDVILSPGSINPYSKVKDEVIARCGESKSQEICRLLAGEQLEIENHRNYFE